MMRTRVWSTIEHFFEVSARTMMWNFSISETNNKASKNIPFIQEQSMSGMKLFLKI